MPDQIVEAEVSQPLGTIPLIFFKGFDTLHDLQDFRGCIRNDKQDTYLRRTFIRISFNPQFWRREARTRNGVATSMTITAGVFERHGEQIEQR